jgi:hypothetical protein
MVETHLKQCLVNSRSAKERILARYVVESLNTHNVWAFKMLFIEFLNLINVIGNIYFIDVFLGREFSTYGLEVRLRNWNHFDNETFSLNLTRC